MILNLRTCQSDKLICFAVHQQMADRLGKDILTLAGPKFLVKSVQSALSDLLTTSATHGTFSRPSGKRGLMSIIKLMQFTIVRFF